jgi:hypothetical protein
MPVSYTIDGSNAIVRKRCIGHVTLPEVLDHFSVLAKDPSCPRRLDVLLDLRSLTSLPTSEQLRAVSQEIGRIRGTVEFGACAIVADQDAVIGTAMVFEVFAAKGFAASRVFPEAHEAEEWLIRGREAVPKRLF